ncbi:hypothetical protein MAR_004328, partial [Mya arenaria]
IVFITVRQQQNATGRNYKKKRRQTDRTSEGLIVVKYDCSHLDTYSPKDTVERARMRISEKKWGPWENRSDHMCFWAKVRDFRPSGAKEHGLLEAVMMLGTTPIHLAHEIELGDHVYLHNTNGIVIEKEDIRKRRKFCLR